METVRHLLSNGEIEKAIHELLVIGDKINDKDIKNFIIAASARFKIFYRKKNLGMGESDEEINKIISSILECIDEIEDKITQIPNVYVDKKNNFSVIEEYYNLKSVIEGFSNLTDEEKQTAYAKSMLLKQYMYENIDLKIKSDYPNILFGRIYYSNDLLEIEFRDLMSMPSDKGLEWFEKSIVVSALTLSLLRKFDDKKIEILIGFINEFENNVWQRALVGVILSLYNRDKLILLYPNLIRKLSELKKHDSVRRGILDISISLKTKNYANHFTELQNFYSIEGFKYFKLPQHWILPFYRMNPVLEKEKINFPNVKDIHLLPELLVRDRHLSNSEKYSILLSIRQWKDNKVEDMINELKRMTSCTRSHEFDRYIKDIYIFVSEFKDENIELYKKNDIELLKTDIISYLISEENIHLVNAEYYSEIEDYETSVKFYINYIRLHPTEQYLYCRTGHLLQKLGRFIEAIEYHQKSYEVDNTHTHSFIGIAECYCKIGDLEKCSEFLEKYKSFPETENNLYWAASGYMSLLKDFKSASKSYEKLLDSKSFSEEALDNLILCKLKLGELNDLEKLLSKYKLINFGSRPKILSVIYDFIKQKKPKGFNLDEKLKPLFDDEKDFIENRDSWYNFFDLNVTFGHK